MAGILYIVPTPVGNLEDMTFRAIRVLKEADLILAEDTRTSSVLLKHYEIKGRLESHHKFNEHKTASMIKERILAGLNVALISDAGTPGISDPGFLHMPMFDAVKFEQTKKAKQCVMQGFAFFERRFFSFLKVCNFFKHLHQSFCRISSPFSSLEHLQL